MTQLQKHHRTYARCWWLALLLLCGLGGCGNSDDATPTAAPTPSVDAATDIPTTDTNEIAPPLAGEFAVIDIGEREVDGRNTIVVEFSAPLDTRQNLSRWLQLARTDQTAVSGAWRVDEDGYSASFPFVEPETRYEVTVLAGLPGAGGRTLEHGQTATLTTRAIQPAVSFTSDGVFLPEDLTTGLPLRAINIDAVNIDFHRIRNANLTSFLTEVQRNERWHYIPIYQASDYSDLVYSGRFAIGGERNTFVERAIPVSDIPALREPGVYLAVMEIPGVYNVSRQAMYFMVTDLGLHVRQYANEIDVVVSSLKTGKAAGGVTVNLQNRDGRVVQSHLTDREGRAVLTPGGPNDNLIIAQKGDGMSVLKLDYAGLDLSSFDIGERPWQANDIFVYMPRDLYRPGERVDFNILLRAHDGQPTETPILPAVIRSPDGNAIAEFSLQPGELGYYHTSFEVPATAPTGRWMIEIERDGKHQTPFQVEDFLPERMELIFNEARQQPLRFSNEAQVQIPVTGRYLYGAPAAGNRMTLTASTAPNRSPFEQWQDYYFGDETEADTKQQFTLADLFLDTEGNASIDIDSRWSGVKSPLSVTVTASLYESGGRPVTRRYIAQVRNPSPLYGIQPTFGDRNPPQNSNAGFRIVYVDAEGEALAAPATRVRLVREDRRYYWDYTEGRGWRRQYSEREVAESEVALEVTAAEPATITLPVRWGHYRLEVFNGESKSTYRFHAGEDWYSRWEENQDAEFSAKPDQVTLAFDKASYQPGDTAKLSIRPPHGGDALIMIESDHPLWVKRMALTDDETTVSIPVGNDWNRHDIYASVLVLRPGSARDRVTPNRALGLLHLPLERESRRLTVEVEVPERMLPQRSLQASVQLRDAAGNPVTEAAMVSIAAVDVGVLNVSSFQTPDPFEYFFGQRRYGVESRDIYSRIIESHQYGKASLRFGGDADLTRGGQRPAEDVQIVSLFHEVVKPDSEGRATVELPVPYFNGRLRVMAVAFTRDRYGSAEDETTVAAPVVSQLSMPRFIGSGDTARIALDLHNLSGADKTIAAHIATGGFLATSEHDESIVLANDQKQTLYVPIRAGTGFGNGSIEVSLDDGEDFQFSRSWTLGVRPAYPASTTAQYTSVLPGQTHWFNTVWAGLEANSREVQLALASTPELNLATHLKNLLRYPYGCLEQTTSTAWPLAFATVRNTELIGNDVISEADRSRRIDAALARLAQLQLSNGGFGLWSEYSEEEYWLTVYVTDFLVSLQEQGFSVPATMYERALARLTTYLQSNGRGMVNRYTQAPDQDLLAYKAYAGYVLARLNRANLGALRTVDERYAKSAESALPLYHLGLALQLQGDATRAQQVLTRAAATRRNEDKYFGDYGSVVRDEAMIVHLMLRHQVDVGAALTRAQGLSLLLAERRWLSTQERNALFLAGIDLQAVSGNAIEAAMLIGDQRESLPTVPRTLRLLDGAALAGRVGITNTGDAPLFTVLTATGYPLTAPAPVNDGIAIERSYYDTSGNSVELRSVATGELVLVRLWAHAEQQVPNALMVDLLPAGFELENQNLDNAIPVDEVSVDGRTLAQWTQDNEVRHVEYRADRFVTAISLGGVPNNTFYLMRAVTPGEYRVPAPLVEDMYRPEIRGIGATIGPVTVEARP